MAKNSSINFSTRVKDLSGLRFGRLAVVSFAGTNESGKARWNCLCDCGASTTVSSKHLQRGSSRSCGCLRSETVSKRRGSLSNNEREARRNYQLEWNSYSAMIHRCHSPRHKDYRYYGARGRRVCDRWRFGDGARSGFECFLEDMPPRPSTALTLDRIENSRGYFPGNCRWATKAEQTANR